MISVVFAVFLYVSLPERLTPGPGWLTGLITMCLAAPAAADGAAFGIPERGRNWQRSVAITLFGVINLSNLISLVLLVDTLLAGGKATGRDLIGEAVKIWLTTAHLRLLVWEPYRGGRRARHWREPQEPDFLFLRW